jgi:LTXXQ motif family protein
VKHHLLIAATAVALALPALSTRVFAAPPEQASEEHQFSPEDIAAFTDARIAALKAGLKLTPAQEKNWPALETALREVAKARAARKAEWQEKAKELHEHHDVIEGLRLGATALSARSADLEKIADAAKPLYDSLDDSQKLRFRVLLHAILKPHGEHGHWGARCGWDSDEHDAGHGG